MTGEPIELLDQGEVASVNGRTIAISGNPSRRLSDFLRDACGLTGTKVGCDAGDCGACTVLLDGEPICACLTATGHVIGRSVTTVEGLKRDGLDRLQRSFLRHGAAQCGICTPGMLMAAHALLGRMPKPRRAEVQDALGGVLCRCTGYTKIVDAVCDAWRDVGAAPLPAAGSVVGARIERLDGVPKIDGREIFGADVMPDNALLVRAIRSPHHRATFLLGDIAAWIAKRPGIVAVYTATDIPGRNCFGVIPPFADQPALADGIVRFRGEAVALVAGEPDTLTGLSLDDFPISWSPDGAVLEPVTALASGAPLVHETRPGNVLVTGRVARGDPDAALETAAHIAEGVIETSYVEHAYIEPEAGAAWMDGDTLVIRACTQAPVMDRDDTAAVLGISPAKVRVIPTAAGGGFGSKLDVSLQPLIGLVALKTGRPARMVYTRTESMASTTKRHPARMQARIGIDMNGRVTGMRFKGDFNTGAYASWGPTVANRVPVHASGPYRTPHYRAEARAVHTNGTPAGAFRGFGVPQATILQETLYDDLAIKAGMDRLAFRRLNALRDGDHSPTGQEMQAVGIVACLDALAPHWDRALADASAFNARNDIVKRGVGVASCWYGCGNTALPNPSTIRVGLTVDGRIRLHQGATDIGQGSNTVVAQICADALGLPLEAFDLVGPDTGITPDAGKTSASRQTYVSGNAARLAGSALREQILRLANVGAGADLRLRNGVLEISENSVTRRIDPRDLPAQDDGTVLRAAETYDPPTTPLDENGQGIPYAVFGYGAQMAEVAIDTALGTVSVRKITAAHDVGRAINPILAEGQIEGGIAQGLGLALMEEFIPGRTENLHDYLIPTIGDMPEIQSILIEIPDPEGPFGAKGLGEHVLIPTAPAILNAIRHACGARITRLPALPHRVKAAIDAARGLS